MFTGIMRLCLVIFFKTFLLFYILIHWVVIELLFIVVQTSSQPNFTTFLSQSPIAITSQPVSFGNQKISFLFFFFLRKSFYFILFYFICKYFFCIMIFVFFQYTWFTVFCQFYTILHGGPVTHTCIHSSFSHYHSLS